MNKRIPKKGKSKPASSKKAQSTLQLPSKIECGTCAKNMTDESYDHSLINEHLTSQEKIVNFDNEIYRYERIQNDAIPNHVFNLKKLRQIELDKIEQKKAANTRKRIKEQVEPNELVKLMGKITFQGGKGDFVLSCAHFYFNPNNPLGLHLSKKQISRIAQMLCEFFKAEDGSFLNDRSVKSYLNQGFNMDKNGVISIK